MPGDSSGKALGYELDCTGSIPGNGGAETLLHSLSRLALGPTQPPVNEYRDFPRGKDGLA